MTAGQIMSAGALHKYLEYIARRSVVCRAELGDNADHDTVWAHGANESLSDTADRAGSAPKWDNFVADLA